MYIYVKLLPWQESDSPVAQSASAHPCVVPVPRSATCKQQDHPPPSSQVINPWSSWKQLPASRTGDPEWPGLVRRHHEPVRGDEVELLGEQLRHLVAPEEEDDDNESNVTSPRRIFPDTVARHWDTSSKTFVGND